MPSSTQILSRLAVGVAGAVGLYAVLIGILLTPSAQRFALYAHKFNTLFLDDLNEPESFGFSPNQVTPFHLQTPDGETLYAWHILPLDIYAKHETRILAADRHNQPVQDFTNTTAYQLLTTSDPEPPRVVVWFHGNAGHLAQINRCTIYRLLSTQPNTHVFTLDYRGFGHSTGSPTESGLITDATTLLTYLQTTLHIPSHRILVLGQSLGTGVSSAVALHFADPTSDLIPAATRELFPGLQPTTFAGVILVAPFSSIPALLLTYRIGGLVPLLLPLRPFPWLAGRLTARMEDRWLSAERLREYCLAVHAAGEGLLGGDEVGGGIRGSLQVVHALNDRDIPFRQSEMICRRMFGERDEASEVEKEEIDAVECLDGGKGTGVLDVKRAGWPRVRFEIVAYGGHNRIVTHSPVAVAVMRAMYNLFE